MKSQDEFWWAYVDGEMTPAETAEYDRTLDPDDRVRIAAEMEFERRLGERLAHPAPDAQDAWKAALALVKENKKAQHPRLKWLRRTAWLAVPIAAIALLTIGLGHARPAPAPWFLSVTDRDNTALASTAGISEISLLVRNLLRDRAVNVSFDPSNSLEAENAPYRLLDAREGEYAGGPVVELLFECSGKLAKVVIAGEKGDAAREIDKAVARGTICASRAIGEWVIAVVGATEPDGLLHLIGDPEPTPSAPPVDAAPDSVSSEPPPPDTAAPATPQETTPDASTPEPPETPANNYPVSVKTVA